MKKELWIVISCILLLNGCALYAYRNKEIRDERPPDHERATFDISDARGHEHVLVLMALSGGGSRAAYFSTSVMFRLQDHFEDMDLLKEVDVISSVSGGSLPAAYYCSSRDGDDIRSVRISGSLNTSALPEALRSKITFDELSRTLDFQGQMSEREMEDLTASLSKEEDRPKLQQLYTYSNVKLRSGMLWEERRVKKAMSQNFQMKWFKRWFWLNNIFRYWFTSFDFSDYLAQTFSVSLFKGSFIKDELRFRDLNPERPYLIINATDATDDEERFGKVFTFTREDFDNRLKSDIGRYRIPNAVAASAAFPGVFNYVTLRNFNFSEEEKYVHVFDGGNTDNLGLTSLMNVLKGALERDPDRYKSVAVILIDSYVTPRGVDSALFDPRTRNFIIDFNFIKTFGTLLQSNREYLKAQMANLGKELENEKGIDFEFLQFTFEDVGDPDLRAKLLRIPTLLKISQEHAGMIDNGVENLFAVEKNRAALDRIRNMLLDE